MNMDRLKIEDEQEWMNEMEHIPFLSFPPEWKVKIIPPFGDAVVRFQVRLPSGTRKSIYLDSRNSLGFYGADLHKPTPYWEVYPVGGDVGRCDRCDTDQLMAMIADETEGERT
jgi:hypothetical protein